MEQSEVFRQVAHLHVANINKGFLSSLGAPFLRLLYEAIDAEPSAVLVTEEKDGQIVGFVAGSVGMGRIYRRLLARAPRLCLALLPALASPTKVRKILELALRGSHNEKNQVARPNAELLSIAVAPSARGTGCADRLYVRLCDRFSEGGVKEFCIVVGEALGPAHKFYRRMGAREIGHVEVHRGEKSVLYLQRVLESGAEK